MGIDKNIYIVKIAKAIPGPKLIAYRQEKGRYQNFDGKYFPYRLAMYLGLMPDTVDNYAFTNKLHDFSNKDLDELAPNGCVLKVSRRGTHRIIKIDLSKV